MYEGGLLALSTRDGEWSSLPFVEEKSSGPSRIYARSVEVEDARMLPMPPIPDDCYM